jgi:hypothetical protein
MTFDGTLDFTTELLMLLAESKFADLTVGSRSHCG